MPRQKPHIYKLTLLRDTKRYKKGVIYIGQTKASNPRYWSGGVLPNRIANKYGQKIFKREIIVEGDFNKELLDELEKHYIRLYASQIKGLNIQAGGDGNTPYPVFEYDLNGVFIESYESARKVAEKYGYSTGSVISVCNMEKMALGKKQYRYFHVDKVEPYVKKRRMSIYQYSLNGEYIREFENTREICEIYGGTPRDVSAVCNPKNPTKSYRGFLWSRTKSDKLEPYRNYKINEVHQYSLSGEYLKSFESMPAAGEFLKGSYSIISEAARGRKISAFGFQWRLEKVDNCGYYENNNAKRVACTDLDGNVLETFDSLTDAAKKIGTKIDYISFTCKGKIEQYKGYKWKFI